MHSYKCMCTCIYLTVLCHTTCDDNVCFVCMYVCIYIYYDYTILCYTTLYYYIYAYICYTYTSKNTYRYIYIYIQRNIM